MPSPWKSGDLECIKAILRNHTRGQLPQALLKINVELERDISKEDLEKYLKKKGFSSILELCKTDKISVDIQKLIKYAKKPIGLQELCDKLDMSPAKTQKLLEEAKDQQVELHIENNHIGLGHTPGWYEQNTNYLSFPPTYGQVQKVAVISDTHLGSKYCLRTALREFIEYAYEQGVREILHPGDVLDGMYKHGMWEVSHPGIDAQCQDLFETLPQKPGLTYHGITGNHDFTFTEAIGLNVGSQITQYFRERGRNDVHFYGDRGAYLHLRGARIHLWHPRSGVSYARSYSIQKQIEKYSSAEKPQILLCGHWHVFCHVFEREVHGVACPTFQGGGSAFSKSLGGSPAIGGLILNWQLTKQGHMRSFAIESRTYSETELFHDVNKRLVP